MKSQETGWLGNMLGWGQRRQQEVSEVLYGNAVEMAREPAFFAEHGVADTIAGRFDMVTAITALAHGGTVSTMVTPGSSQSATKTAKELTTSRVSKPGF